MSNTARIVALFAVLMAAAPMAIRAGAAEGVAVDPFLAAVRVAQRPGVPVAAFATDIAGGVVQTSGYADISVDPTAQHNPAAQYDPTAHYAPSTETWGYATPSVGPCWEILPDGFIYRAYQAGPRESRTSLHVMHNDSTATGAEYLWDATVGGRKGILRYGNGDPTNPIGWQIDIEGAAIVRLNIDENRDLDASDFRFGVPFSYTAGDGLSYKFGYYHLSSHLGDEFITRNSNTRLNYVRDAIIAGVSYQITPSWRIYGETAYAFFTAGGAEPWEFQIGAEWSRPGPTGFAGTPFVATNAHLREEIDFGGDWTLQTGWLWRGDTGSTLRLGLHYMNGKSTQYQFFADNEEQIGFGIWCDF